MSSKYYHESIGECVSQVYEIEANSWEDAKKVAFFDMAEGDILAECEPAAVITNSEFPEYHYIDKEQCTEYAKLQKGTWAQRESSGKEYWESNVWYFDDDDETFYDVNFENFEDWEADESEE